MTKMSSQHQGSDTVWQRHRSFRIQEGLHGSDIVHDCGSHEGGEDVLTFRGQDVIDCISPFHIMHYSDASARLLRVEPLLVHKKVLVQLRLCGRLYLHSSPWVHQSLIGYITRVWKRGSVSNGLQIHQ
eukprot:XP_001708656.1 Hypothetical protein GL50803_106139 [Giardia lamblia ATCC 50803]